MPRFVLTNAAKADLKSIGRYTEKAWGREQRNRYLALLDASMHDLADNPTLGRDCSEIRVGYRRFRTGKHLLFYRQIEPDQIEIVRILHERMDVEVRLSNP